RVDEQAAAWTHENSGESLEERSVPEPAATRELADGRRERGKELQAKRIAEAHGVVPELEQNRDEGSERECDYLLSPIDENVETERDGQQGIRRSRDHRERQGKSRQRSAMTAVPPDQREEGDAERQLAGAMLPERLAGRAQAARSERVDDRDDESIRATG